MKRGSNTSLSDRVAKMSIKELIITILVLLALIILFVLIALVIGQNADGGNGRIEWITRLGVILI